MIIYHLHGYLVTIVTYIYSLSVKKGIEFLKSGHVVYSLLCSSVECGQLPMAADLAEKYRDFQVLVQLCERLNDKEKLRAYMRQFADQVSCSRPPPHSGLRSATAEGWGLRRSSLWRGGSSSLSPQGFSDFLFKSC